MRGKGIIDISIIMIHRITPAYAGKRRFLSCVTTIFWDHPRLCGEKVVVSTSAGTNRRITPAYAGKRAESLRTQTVR